MRIEVCGCYGTEIHSLRTPSFIINSCIAIDAGSITSALSIEAISRIKTIFLTHGHLDHIKDLSFLAELATTSIDSQIDVYGSRTCLEILKEHIFNGKVWPDFSSIPDDKSPVLNFRELKAGDSVKVDSTTIEVLEVDHPGGLGYIVSENDKAVAFSGDRGQNDNFIAELKRKDGFVAIFMEVSFPLRLRKLAELTQHLSTDMLISELTSLDLDDIPIYLYHLKAPFIKEIKGEVFRGVEKGKKVVFLEQGALFAF